MGLTLAPQDGTVRTPMDTGPHRIRRRVTAVSILSTRRVVFTNGEKKLFDAFFNTTLEGGSQKFELENPDNDNPGPNIPENQFIAPVRYRLLTGGLDVNLWAATTAYIVGDFVLPTIGGLLFQATVAGTSGGSEPTFPTTIGATVVDGGVTWQGFENSRERKWEGTIELEILP